MEQRHRRVLVTGPGGSGKTTLANYFKSRGKNAVDADLAGIGFWLDDNLSEVKFPDGESTSGINKWAQERGLSWHWRKEALSDPLSGCGEIYVMGSARNGFELSVLFDETYYPDASEMLITERLKRRSEAGESYHDNGKTHKQRKEIVRKMGAKREEAERRGFRFIDTSMSPEEVYGVIADE